MYSVITPLICIFGICSNSLSLMVLRRKELSGSIYTYLTGKLIFILWKQKQIFLKSHLIHSVNNENWTGFLSEDLKSKHFQFEIASESKLLYRKERKQSLSLISCNSLLPFGYTTFTAKMKNDNVIKYCKRWRFEQLKKMYRYEKVIKLCHCKLIQIWNGKCDSISTLQIISKLGI